MSLEAVRLVADWLADAATGVTAVVGQVPRDAGDPAPGALAVYDATRTGWVARGFVGAAPGTLTFPCVAVAASHARFPVGPRVASSGAYVQDGEQAVVCYYLDRDPDSAAAAARASYARRAVRGALDQFHAAPAATARTRNGVQLVLCAGVEERSLAEAFEDVVAYGATLVTYKTRETVGRVAWAPAAGAPAELMVADGNSLIVGTGASAPSLSLVGRLATRYAGVIDIVNTGVGGRQTPQQTAEAPAAVDPLYDPARPRNWILAWELTNHLAFGAATPQDAYDAFVAYCAARKAAHPSVTLVALSLTARAGFTRATLEDTQALMRADPLSYCDGLVDLAWEPRVGGYGANFNTDYIADGVHFTDAGYALVEAMAAATINALRAPATPRVADVALPATLTLPDGDTGQLAPAATDQNGAPIATTVRYASADPAVATVDAAGLVTAQAPGTATVTASVLDPVRGIRTAACAVTVEPSGAAGAFDDAPPVPADYTGAAAAGWVADVGAGGVPCMTNPAGTTTDVPRAGVGTFQNGRALLDLDVWAAAGVGMRFQSASDFVLTTFTPDTVFLWECVAGTFTNLGSRALPAGSGRRVVALVCAGTAMSVEVDGIQLGAAVTLSRVTAGTVSIRHGGGTMRVYRVAAEPA